MGAATPKAEFDSGKPIQAAQHVDDPEDRMNLKDLSSEALARGQGVSGYETLTLWETVKAFKMNTFICFMVAFSAATDGYQIAMNNNIVANPGFVSQFGTTVNAAGKPALESPILSGWSSIMSVGQIIGMVHLPFISDRFGRKVAMYWYSLILACSVLCESLARSWEVWLVAKLLAGVGVGCLQSTAPAYIAETAPVRIRGGLLMSYSFWFTLGAFFAPMALNVMSDHSPNEWLIPIYTQWSQVGLMVIIYLFVPESPAWCVSKGKEEQAKASLRYLNRGVQNYDVEQQYQLLILNFEHERTIAAEQKREKWYAIFLGTDGKRTVVACWTLLSQQFIGLTLFANFSSYFFQQSGVKDPFEATSITAGIKLASGIAVVFLADVVGRRRLACIGTTICWGSCLCIGILGVAPRVDATVYLFITFACIWNIGLVANGATAWGFIGEISSQRLRPYTAGFGAASTCVVGVVMNVLVPYMVNASRWNWGLKTGWFYAGIGLPFTVAMWFIVPETSGRSAAELDELFERKIKPWKFHKTETATQRMVNDGGRAL